MFLYDYDLVKMICEMSSCDIFQVTVLIHTPPYILSLHPMNKFFRNKSVFLRGSVSSVSLATAFSLRPGQSSGELGRVRVELGRPYWEAPAWESQFAERPRSSPAGHLRAHRHRGRGEFSKTFQDMQEASIIEKRYLCYWVL